MSEALQQALTAVELRESELLSWGAVGAEWHRSELVDVLNAHGDGESLLAEMLELALIVHTPAGGYRSRSAETVRLLATLRQAFRREAVLQGGRSCWTTASSSAHGVVQRRNVAAAELEASVGPSLEARGMAALRTLSPSTVSEFQVRSTRMRLGSTRYNRRGRRCGDRRHR